MSSGLLPGAPRPAPGRAGADGGDRPRVPPGRVEPPQAGEPGADGAPRGRNGRPRFGRREGRSQPGGAQPGPPGRIRAGDIPPLAEGFSPRPETGPGPGLLQPAQSLALTLARLPSQAPGQPGGRPAAQASGTGLTQCAASLAESMWRNHQVDLLVWTPAESRASILAAYARGAVEAARTFPEAAQALGHLAAAAGPAAAAARPRDPEALAARFLAWLASAAMPWLVVLDGAVRHGDLDGLWPQGPGGRVLITTRDPAALPRAQRPRIFPLGPFSTHEALTYLLSRLSADPDQRVGAVDLLADLGGDPLALAQAAATIISSGMTCRDYREAFLRERDGLAAGGGEPPSSPAVTWRLAAQQASSQAGSGLAVRCLTLAALAAGHGLPAAVLAAPAASQHIAPAAGAAAHGQVGDALLALQRAGLLSVDPPGAARLVRVPQAVRDAVLASTPPALAGETARAAAAALLQAWPPDEHEPWAADAFRSCAASLDLAAGESLWRDGRHSVLLHAGRSLERAGLPGPAVAHWRALAAACEGHLGAAHPDYEEALGRLARTSLAAGMADQAVAVCQRIADIRSGSLGPAHPRTIAAELDVGGAQLAAGRVSEAIGVLERALRSCPDSPAGEEPDVLALQDRLAAAYRAAGRLREAISLGAQTLAQRERRQGADHPDAAATRARLAGACLAAGEPEDAIVHGKRALADRERLLGRDHPETLETATTLATAYHTAGRLKEAIRLYERALADWERVRGADDPHTLSVRGNLASALHSAGRITRALPLYELNRAECQRVLGAQHPDTLTARVNLAHAYCAAGRLTDGVALLRAALADCEQALAPGDPLTAAVQESLQAVGGR